MNQAKELLYQYVANQTNTIIAGRESLISRFASILVIAGLLLTVFSFSFGIFIDTLSNVSDYILKAVCISPILFFFLSIYYMIRSILIIPDIVGSVKANIPGVIREKVMNALDIKNIDEEHVLRSLTSNYISAFEKNVIELNKAASILRKSTNLIRLSILHCIIFLLATIIIGVVVRI